MHQRQSLSLNRDWSEESSSLSLTWKVLRAWVMTIDDDRVMTRHYPNWHNIKKKKKIFLFLKKLYKQSAGWVKNWCRFWKLNFFSPIRKLTNICENYLCKFAKSGKFIPLRYFVLYLFLVLYISDIVQGKVTDDEDKEYFLQLQL